MGVLITLGVLCFLGGFILGVLTVFTLALLAQHKTQERDPDDPTTNLYH